VNRALTTALTLSGVVRTAGAFATFAAFGTFGTLALACDTKASRAECTEMLDKYVFMTAGGEGGFADLPAAEATAARRAELALRKSETRYARVQQQCEAEITRREYRCAMKAPSPETWQACID
jgi:hypothetical protein